MSEITGDYTQRTYSHNDDYNTQEMKEIKKTTQKELKEITTDTSEDNINFDDMDLNELIAQKPELKAIINNLFQVVDSATDDSHIFTIQKLIHLLIDLGSTLQGAAVVQADRLNKITEKMNFYSIEMTQIPVVLKDDVKFGSKGDDADRIDSERRSSLNQKFSAMLETIRAYKGMEEDKAKKVQMIMQSSKDAGQTANDFVGTFIDLFRGISQKIMR